MAKTTKESALHQALPQKMTPEQLGVWISENAADRRTHIEKTPLTEDQKLDYKDKIALATAKIYELDELKKTFDSVIKKGTTYDINVQQHVPQDFQIPPTKGKDRLEENRRFYNDTLNDGFEKHETQLFGIPWIEGKKLVFFDGAGKEYFDEPMSQQQSEDLNAASQLFPATEDQDVTESSPLEG